MSRILINRVLNANAFYLHFNEFVSSYNKLHETDLHVGLAGINIATALLRSPLLRRYQHFSRSDLILNYRSVVSDIGFMMFAVVDELFHPGTRGNYTDARYHALMEYVFRLMRECSSDFLAPEHQISRLDMVAIGRRLHLNPIEAFDYFKNVNIQIDEYRALGRNSS